jgi:hypothetical protein
MRVLYQVNKGRVKIDKDLNALIVYQEDGITPLYSCPLRRNGVGASIYADEKLTAV